MFRCDLCDYGGVNIIVKGRITIIDTNNAKARNKSFKNNAPIRSCISKINIKFTNISEDLDIFVSMYNKLEYNKNYPKFADLS